MHVNAEPFVQEVLERHVVLIFGENGIQLLPNFLPLLDGIFGDGSVNRPLGRTVEDRPILMDVAEKLREPPKSLSGVLAKHPP